MWNRRPLLADAHRLRSSDSKRASVPTARELGVVVAGFTAVTLLLTLPLVLHPTRVLPSDLIDTLLNTWIISWDADRLRHGLRGVWDAPIYHPYRNTLAFSENLFGLAFLVAPVYWASGDPVLTYNVAFLLAFVIAGAGMYLLVRSLTNDRTAAAVAGACFAFCPYRFTQLSHVQILATGWIPITLWGLHQYLETARRRWLMVFAGGWVMQTLSNIYVCYFIAVPIAVVAAEGWLRQRTSRRRIARDLVLAFGLVVVILAPVGMAYYHVRTNYQQVRNTMEIADGGADVRSYLVAKDSIGIGRWLPTAMPYNYERELFAGVFALALAAIAIASVHGRGKPLKRWIRLYALIALAAFVLSLGQNVRVWGHLVTTHGPYEWLVRLVPGMDGMRVVARFAIVYFAAISVLAGIGASLLVSQVRTQMRPLAIAICLIGIVADAWAVPIRTQSYRGAGRPEDRAVAEWLRDKPAGVVLHLPMLPVDFRELNYQYATLFHGHPLVNGFSGYNTRLQEFLRNVRSPLSDFDRFPATVRMLRDLGVRYVVLHPNDYNSDQAGEVPRTIEGFRKSGQLIREARLFGTSVFELEAWPEKSGSGPVASIGSDQFTASASEAVDRLPLVFDGNNETRWIGGMEKPDAPEKWLTLRFHSPQDIARLELQLAERTWFDLPREFEIEVSDRSGQSKTLYRDTPYAALAAAIVRNPQYPAMVFTLPPNETITLTLRDRAVALQVGKWWSVHEVRLWRRQR